MPEARSGQGVAPIDPETLALRRERRLVRVLVVVLGAALFGILSIVSLLVGLPTPPPGSVLQNVLVLVSLTGTYLVSYLYARARRFEAARTALFGGWLGYVGLFLALNASVGGVAFAVVVGVSTGFTAMVLVGIVALASERRTVPWLVATLLMYGVAALGAVAQLPDPSDKPLWAAGAVSGFVLLGAAALLAHSFTRDLYASVAHSRIAVREALNATEAKSRFLANMSHELRTPLTGIVGMVELLQEIAADEGRQDAVEDLQRIGAAATHLNGVIGDVLDLSKIEAGKLILAVESVELPPLLEHVVATSRAIADDQGTSVELETEGLPTGWNTDPGRLRQVLLNLLSNAAKFTPQGRMGLRARGVDEGVAFEVWDTGVGIPSDKLEIVFRPFEQADSSATRTQGGTGLGLSISRQLVAMLGGTLRASSEPGQGTTFWFTLPSLPPRGARVPTKVGCGS